MSGFVPLSNIILDFRQATGEVNAGGTLEFFDNLTETYKDVFNGYGSTTPLSNPLQLDASGFEPGAWLGSGAYSIRLRGTAPSYPTVLGPIIWTKDNVNITSAITAQPGNFIANGSFENGDDGTGTGAPTSWALTTYTGSTFLLDSTDTRHGAYSAKCTSVGNGGATLVTTDFTACSVGDMVVWKLLMKSTVADVRNIVSIAWYDSAQALLSATSVYDDSATNPTAWTVKSGVTTPPANSKFYKVTLIGCSPTDPTAGSTWFDGVEFGTLPRQETANTWAALQTFTSGLTSTGTLTMTAKAINEAKGANVASVAGTTDIWTPADGQTVHITGTNAMTGFGTAPQAGAIRHCIADGACSIVDGANLVCPGGNIQCAADDAWDVYADTTTKMYVLNYTRANGSALAPSVRAQSFLTPGTFTNGFTAPASGLIFLTGAAAGGGGAGENAAGSGGGAGGAGAGVIRHPLFVTPLATYDVVIPAKGAGAVGNGAAGGDLIFRIGGGGAELLRLGGGGGGISGDTSGNGGPAGTSTDALTYAGAGANGITGYAAGGKSVFGKGANNGTTGTGDDAVFPGAGGAGAYNAAGIAAGGDGDDGALIIEW